LQPHPVEWDEALRSYAQAVDLAAHNDWQPQLRLGLLLQRMVGAVQLLNPVDP
jgi:hypothetical protein